MPFLHFKITMFGNHHTGPSYTYKTTFSLTALKSIKQNIDHWQVLSVSWLSAPISIASRYCPYCWWFCSDDAYTSNILVSSVMKIYVLANLQVFQLNFHLIKKLLKLSTFTLFDKKGALDFCTFSIICCTFMKYVPLDLWRSFIIFFPKGSVKHVPSKTYLCETRRGDLHRLTMYCQSSISRKLFVTLPLTTFWFQCPFTKLQNRI